MPLSYSISSRVVEEGIVLTVDLTWAPEPGEKLPTRAFYHLWEGVYHQMYSWWGNTSAQVRMAMNLDNPKKKRTGKTQRVYVLLYTNYPITPNDWAPGLSELAIRTILGFLDVALAKINPKQPEPGMTCELHCYMLSPT